MSALNIVINVLKVNKRDTRTTSTDVHLVSFFVNFKSTLKSCVVPPKGLKTKNFNKNVKDIYLGANRFVRALINTGSPHYKKSSNKHYPV